MIITRTEIAKTGPVGDSYHYRIGDRLSVPYANAASARNAASKRRHRVLDNGQIEPAS